MSKRILRVMGCSSYNYASQEKYMVLLSRALAKKGHRFFLVYENVPENKEYIRDLKAAGTILIKISPRRNIESKTRNPFIKKLMRPFYDLFDFPSLVKCSFLIDKYNIDVVHSYFSNSLYAIVTGKFKGTKTCRTLANPFLSLTIRSKPSFTMEVYCFIRYILPTIFLDKQIALSKIIEKEINDYILDKSKLCLISSGIDSTYFDPAKFDNNYLRKELGFDSSLFLIGYTGRLDGQQKNLVFALKIIKEVSEQYANIRFILVGGGTDNNNSYKNKLIEECKALGISDKVIFLGRRPDVPFILRDVEMYLITSLYEGLPSSLMEAMSMEIPCVTSDAQAFKEIIVTGKTGFVCSLASKKTFCKSIVELINNPNAGNKIGVQARKTIIERYDVRDRVNSTIKLYESL